MERRAFLFSCILSGVAMLMVFQYISGKDSQLEADYGERTSEPVVVAARDILQYETVRPTDVEIVRVPHIALPPGRINSPTDVIDAVAAVPMTKGEFILDNKIISKNVYSGLDKQVTVGRRAVSLRVNPKSSVGYMIRPGNRVDLAAHFEYKSQATSISEVKVFMQDLLVLAAGRTIQADPPNGVDQSVLRNVIKAKEKELPLNPADVRETLNYAKTDSAYQTVTLEVTPQQAQTIVYVSTVFEDSIICLLRQSDDRQLQRVATTDLGAVMGQDSYYIRGRRQPASPISIPITKFMDYIGTEAIPVSQ